MYGKAGGKANSKKVPPPPITKPEKVVVKPTKTIDGKELLDENSLKIASSLFAGSIYNAFSVPVAKKAVKRALR